VCWRLPGPSEAGEPSAELSVEAEATRSEPVQCDESAGMKKWHISVEEMSSHILTCRKGLQILILASGMQYACEVEFGSWQAHTPAEARDELRCEGLTPTMSFSTVCSLGYQGESMALQGIPQYEPVATGRTPTWLVGNTQQDFRRSSSHRQLPNRDFGTNASSRPLQLRCTRERSAQVGNHRHQRTRLNVEAIIPYGGD
jgi:hypothetical protein